MDESGDEDGSGGDDGKDRDVSPLQDTKPAAGNLKQFYDLLDTAERSSTAPLATFMASVVSTADISQLATCMRQASEAQRRKVGMCQECLRALAGWLQVCCSDFSAVPGFCGWAEAHGGPCTGSVNGNMFCRLRLPRDVHRRFCALLIVNSKLSHLLR